jgi:hypothetical protein
MSKRTALTVAGLVLTVAGGGAAVGGGALLLLTGGDGTVSSGSHAWTTPTAALVTETADIDGGASAVLGHPDVRLTVRGADERVFVGVGRAADVDAYLAGAPREIVTDLDVNPFHLTTTVRDGAATLAPPGEQDFWVSRSEGARTAHASWKVHDGRYRMVVMNADGSPGVDVDGTVAAHVPLLLGAGATAAAGGLGLVALGVGLTVAGARTRPEPQQPTATVVESPYTYV